MSMKVVFLKPYEDYANDITYEVFDEVYISRTLGRRLCQQEITIPISIKDEHIGYNALVKASKPKAEPRKTAPRKKAVSKKVKTRKKAVPE